MVRSLIVRLVCPIVGVAAAFAGWDAEACCHRSRRAACCEPAREVEVVYETVRPACCPTVCEPACPAPCAPVTCCEPRHVHHAHVVIGEEIVVPAARCCAAVTTVIEGVVVADAPAPAPSRGRVIAAPVSRRLR